MNCSSEMITVFHSEILKPVEQFVPETQDRGNESKPRAHWWRKYLTKATNQLFYLSKDDYSRYVVQRNLTKSLIRQAQRNFEVSLFQNIHGDPKSFYKYIRSMGSRPCNFCRTIFSDILISHRQSKALPKNSGIFFVSSLMKVDF